MLKLWIVNLGLWLYDGYSLTVRLLIRWSLMLFNGVYRLMAALLRPWLESDPLVQPTPAGEGWINATDLPPDPGVVVQVFIPWLSAEHRYMIGEYTGPPFYRWITHGAQLTNREISHWRPIPPD